MYIPIKPRAGTAATKLQDAFQLVAPLALELVLDVSGSPVLLGSTVELLEELVLEEVIGVALGGVVLVLTAGGVVLGVVKVVLEVVTGGGLFGVVIVL